MKQQKQQSFIGIYIGSDEEDVLEQPRADRQNIEDKIDSGNKTWKEIKLFVAERKHYYHLEDNSHFYDYYQN